MRIIDIALKDLKRSIRSLFFIGMAVIAPLLITALISVAFSGNNSDKVGLPSINAVFVNLDKPSQGQSSLGEVLVKNVLSQEYMHSWLQLTEETDAEHAKSAVIKRERDLAIIIPPGFSDGLYGISSSDDIILFYDPTLSVGPAVVKATIDSFTEIATGSQAALKLLNERQQHFGISGQSSKQNIFLSSLQAWFSEFEQHFYSENEISPLAIRAPAIGDDSKSSKNETKSILALILTGQMIFFSFYTGAYSMLSILREKEEGTLLRLFTVPIKRTLILAGKLLAVIITVLVQALVLIVAGIVIFKIDWGAWPTVVLAVLGQVGAASGLGVLLISLVKNTRQGGAVLGGGLTALGMLGGLFTVAIPNLPSGMNIAALFTPQGWVLRSWRLALSGGNPAEMMMPMLMTLLFGILMFTAGSFIFQRRFS